MTEDQDGKDSQSDSGSKTYINKLKEKKSRSQRPLTKIIMRRLPPTMTEEAFLEQVSPIPEHDHFYFAKPDPSLGNNIYSRAYINFVNVEDIYLFRDKFDGYVFLDEKGVEYVGIVEYAPFQRIPKKKKKKDPKCGTIESDPIYQEFVDSLTREQETENQPKLEYSYPIGDGSDKKNQSTPLLEYLAARKQDKRGRDERRRRENDKRKMRIERKTKESPIKIIGDLSEDEPHTDKSEFSEQKIPTSKFWSRDQRVYHKTKSCHSYKTESKRSTCSENANMTDSDWESHFPALSMKTHSTFTLSSNKLCDKKGIHEAIQKSGGDTCYKEDEADENEAKKLKSKEWEKEKPRNRDDFKSDKDCTVFESKSYRDRKINASNAIDKKKRYDSEKREEEADDSDRGSRKDRKEKLKESPRDMKSKKYSDTRKDRIKQTETSKSDKPSSGKVLLDKPETKTPKSLNYDDIKPFTQLPQVKTEDLAKLIEGMDRKMKFEESLSDKGVKDEEEEVEEVSKVRRNSLDSGSSPKKEDRELFRQKSLDNRSKSTDREGSEEKEQSESGDRRTERRIRNKDRPSLVIYQPGMGKFSKQRIAKEKDTPTTAGKTVDEREKKDT